jgi:hypothetical protein
MASLVPAKGGVKMKNVEKPEIRATVDPWDTRLSMQRVSRVKTDAVATARNHFCSPRPDVLG